jgi:hypothetical protein
VKLNSSIVVLLLPGAPSPFGAPGVGILNRFGNRAQAIGNNPGDCRCDDDNVGGTLTADVEAVSQHERRPEKGLSRDFVGNLRRRRTAERVSFTARLLGEFDQALTAFWNATTELGVERDVNDVHGL